MEIKIPIIDILEPQEILSNYGLKKILIVVYYRANRAN